MKIYTPLGPFSRYLLTLDADYLCGWCAQQKFTKDYEKQIKQFGMMRKYDDSQEYLLQHPHLTCEETANYLVIWCINLEVEEVRSTHCNPGIPW